MERETSEWSIQDVARLAGTTSRTLRHYDAVGLVAPSRTGGGGIRYYDADGLVRLQRVLLLRGLGLGIPAIAEVLRGETDDVRALDGHLAWLREERARLDRRIASVERTIHDRREGNGIMADTMFDGFDHTRYEAEVTERWGADAYARSDAWWRGMSDDERTAWKERAAQLQADWRAAWESGVAPDSEAAQALAERQAAWLGAVPGTPPVTAEYLTGLGDMYVADPRFGRHYGGPEGAAFVRDALRSYGATLRAD
jgi:MerR family transcriptional regulator, thiopeptide resistance regulator